MALNFQTYDLNKTFVENMKISWIAERTYTNAFTRDFRDQFNVDDYGTYISAGLNLFDATDIRGTFLPDQLVYLLDYIKASHTEQFFDSNYHLLVSVSGTAYLPAVLDKVNKTYYRMPSHWSTYHAVQTSGWYVYVWDPTLPLGGYEYDSNIIVPYISTILSGTIVFDGETYTRTLTAPTGLTIETEKAVLHYILMVAMTSGTMYTDDTTNSLSISGTNLRLEFSKLTAFLKNYIDLTTYPMTLTEKRNWKWMYLLGIDEKWLTWYTENPSVALIRFDKYMQDLTAEQKTELVKYGKAIAAIDQGVSYDYSPSLPDLTFIAINVDYYKLLSGEAQGKIMEILTRVIVDVAQPTFFSIEWWRDFIFDDPLSLALAFYGGPVGLAAFLGPKLAPEVLADLGLSESDIEGLMDAIQLATAIYSIYSEGGLTLENSLDTISKGIAYTTKEEAKYNQAKDKAEVDALTSKLDKLLEKLGEEPEGVEKYYRGPELEYQVGYDIKELYDYSNEYDYN